MWIHYGDSVTLNVFVYSSFDIEINPNWNQTKGDVGELYIYDENDNLISNINLPTNMQNEPVKAYIMQNQVIENAGSRLKIVLVRNDILGLSSRVIVYPQK